MNIVRVPDEWGVKRVPPCNESDMFPNPETFKDRFDYDTLFVDAIRLNDQVVLLIGAPLLNLEKVFFLSDGTSRLQTKLQRMDRCSYLYVQTTSNTIYADNGSHRVEIQVSARSTKFNGLRTMVTNQRDEPLHWIDQWVEYYYKVHGVRGFIFYNNYCESTTSEVLENYISERHPDVVVECLDFDVPIGPRSTQWNSDFGLYLKFEHVKQKYAWCSELLFNNDIDELVVLYDDITMDGIYEQLLSDNKIGVVYGTQNIDPYNERLSISASELPTDQIFYSDYYLVGEGVNNPNIYGNNSFAKWIVIPQKAMNIQWKTHYLGNNQNCHVIPKEPKQILAAHYYAFYSSASNKKSNMRRNVSKTNVNDLVRDEYLKKLMKSL